MVTAAVPVVSYPRVHTRGPIEATRSEVSAISACGYPRVHTRGPIEA